MYPFPPNRIEVSSIPWPAIVGWATIVLIFLGIVVFAVRQRPTDNPRAFRLWLMTMAVMLQCSNNLKQIGLAFHDFHQTHGRFPSASGPLPDAVASNLPVSWRVALLPFLDERDLFERYDLTTPWDSASNQSLQRDSVGAYLCPARERAADDQGAVFTSYVVPTGGTTIFADPTGVPVTLGMINDTSNTLLAVEACGSSIIWTDPRDLDVRRTLLGVNLPGSFANTSDGLVSSYHTGGANVLLADGSVRFVSQNVDAATMRELIAVPSRE